MKPRVRNIAILAVAWLLALCVIYLSQDLEQANSYPLLFIPLILLAGFWEGSTAALVLTIASGLALFGAGAWGFIVRDVVRIDLVVLGLTFGLTVLLLFSHESMIRAAAHQRLPLEAKLLKVEKKVGVIQGQIEEHERRIKSLAQLYESTKKLLGMLDVGPLLDEARTVVAKTLPNHFGPQAEDEARLGFYLPDEESTNFLRQTTSGHEVSDEGFPAVIGQTDLRRWLGETFSPIRVKDVGQDARFNGLNLPASTRSLLMIPMIMHEILIGVMLLSTDRADAFSPMDFNRAGLLGKQIVFALRKALLYRKVQTLSITDNLTGLYVHRHFQDRFREELHRAERYRHFLSLILIDLDNFKRVNDAHGHPIGDAVLAETATRIREAAGVAAVVARYGGEEFAVLLPHATKARAAHVAEVIKQLVKSTPVDVGGARIPITLSGGVATYPEDALTRESLINAADTALYDAKRNGRDLIASYSRQTKEKNN